jgi:hypothetical protein
VVAIDHHQEGFSKQYPPAAPKAIKDPAPTISGGFHCAWGTPMSYQNPAGCSYTRFQDQQHDPGWPETLRDATAGTACALLLAGVASFNPLAVE